MLSGRVTGAAEMAQAAMVDAGAAVARRVLPPEQAHRAAVLSARAGMLPQQQERDDSRLEVKLPCGLVLRNSLGVAAGFDKDCECATAMVNAGFGHTEVGTITRKSQTGNPKPRVFRAPSHHAIVNRLGFNSSGASAVAPRLKEAYQRREDGVIGVNVGKNYWVEAEDAAEEYAAVAELLAPFADYLTINISSPNTPGLRSLQSRSYVSGVISTVRDAACSSRGSQHEVPLFVKISPDMDEESVAEVVFSARSSGATGVVVSNTTISRPERFEINENGGLSGPPLFDLSTRALSVAREHAGSDMTLIGVGGVSSGKDAYEKILAGASLVQMYTALVYQGPNAVQRIKRELLECIERDGFSSVQDAIGASLSD